MNGVSAIVLVQPYHRTRTCEVGWGMTTGATLTRTDRVPTQHSGSDPQRWADAMFSTIPS
ncbi:hypothetical protein GCM10027088_15080 [Nocardia goodfellowii]